MAEHTEVVPDVHFAAERPHFDDGLPEKVVRLLFEMLLHPRLDVIVLIPHSHLNPVRGIVALAGIQGERKQCGLQKQGVHSTQGVYSTLQAETGLLIPPFQSAFYHPGIRLIWDQ